VQALARQQFSTSSTPEAKKEMLWLQGRTGFGEF
jgi:hypothetical protein